MTDGITEMRKFADDLVDDDEVEFIAKVMHQDTVARNNDGDIYPSWEQENYLVRLAFLWHAKSAFAAMRRIK